MLRLFLPHASSIQCVPVSGCLHILLTHQSVLDFLRPPAQFRNMSFLVVLIRGRKNCSMHTRMSSLTHLQGVH